jgi:UDP-N-acetylmuramoyl-tripeptide--D-alanyl-D-alanine ligase
MAELGKSAKQWHKRIASYVKAAGVNTIITIGELSYFTANKCKDFNITALHCENIDEIEKFLKLILNKNDIILIKGSRIMKLEKIIEKIKYLN